MHAARAPARAARQPDGALLESVRHLGRRFPAAGLREVEVARAPALDADVSGRAWLAVESRQTTGSFKVRGALVAVADVLRRRGPGARVVCASAGNHGAGVAWAARVLGARATVVVPRDAPEAKRARIAGAGAELIVCEEPGYDAAEARALALARDTEGAFVSPYDDVRVVAGNGASLAFELARALGRAPDVVVTPFGGGGLASGLACGFRHDGAAARVWGAQSEASAAMALSLDRGEAVTSLAPAETLADALEGGIAEEAFRRAAALVEGVLVVTERAIARAMVALERDHGLAPEGGGAAAVAAALSRLPEAARGGDVVLVVSGGNVDSAARARAAALASELPT